MSAPSAARVLALLCAAGRRGGELTAAEAARLLGVGEDELPGVLRRLTDLGAPPFGPEDLVELDLSDGWLVVGAPAALEPPFPLTPLDAALLLGCLRSLARGPGALAQPLGEASEVLAAALAGEESGEGFAWAAQPATDRALLDALARAAAEGEELTVVFWNASRDQVESRPFLPELVVQHTGLWYAVGRAPGGRRFLRLDRILAASPTGRRGEPATPDPASLRRPWLFDPPAETLCAEVRFDRAWLAEARAYFPEARPVRGRPGVLAIPAPTWPTLLRALFDLAESWEILAPEEPRALARAWAAKTVAPC